MSLYVLILTYQKPLEMVDHHLAAHRAHLKQGYEQKLLLLSGPQEPRQGGVIIAQTPDREILEAFIASDPFKIHGVADYQIIQFNPALHQLENFQVDG